MPDDSKLDFTRSEYIDYITNVVENETMLDVLITLLDFAIKNAYKVKKGQGEWNLQYRIKTWDSTAMLYGWDRGYVYVRLGNFPWMHPRTKSSFVNSLTKLSDGFEYLKRLIDQGKIEEQFSIKETLVDPAIMSAFQKTVLIFQDKVYNTPPFGYLKR
jgi:hypothetical protein